MLLSNRESVFPSHLNKEVNLVAAAVELSTQVRECPISLLGLSQQASFFCSLQNRIFPEFFIVISGFFYSNFVHVVVHWTRSHQSPLPFWSQRKNPCYFTAFYALLHSIEKTENDKNVHERIHYKIWTVTCYKVHKVPIPSLLLLSLFARYSVVVLFSAFNFLNFIFIQSFSSV